MYALSSLLILEVYFYKIVFKDISSIRYGSKILKTPGMAESGYVQKGTLQYVFESDN